MKSATRVLALAVLLGWAAPLAPVLGQDPVRAFAMGDPMPGSEAPAFVLPYARAEGPGPVDQPFALRAELGRVVVLAICPAPTDSANVMLLRSFATRFAELFDGDVVVAAVVPEVPAGAAALAEQHGLPFKVLSDSTGRVRRMFGVDQRGLGVYVVDTRGRVAWRDVRFNAYDTMIYDRVRQETARALSNPRR